MGVGGNIFRLRVCNLLLAQSGISFRRLMRGLGWKCFLRKSPRGFYRPIKSIVLFYVNVLYLR